MYKLILKNQDEEILLHHYVNQPDAPKVTSFVGKFGLNSVPSLTLDIPYTHKAFNSFKEFKSHVVVLDEDDNEIFFGRLINPSDQFDTGLSKVLIFEGELAYLNDSTIRPKEWHDYSVKDFLTEVLEEHNSQVEDYKKIYVGNVTVEANLYRMADYEKTLPFLLDRLPKRLGGFFNLRKENGVKYLDYLLDVGKVSNQAIVFGNNMLEFQRDCDTSCIFTKLVPLGANISQGTEESPVGNRLTIESVNDGKDYLINESAVAKYGVLETTNTWDDVTLPENLKVRGEEYLKEISKPRRSISMRVADMHKLQINYDEYKLGDEVPIKCDVFEVDENYRIVEMSIDFMNPLNNQYIFGSKLGTLTDKQIIMQNSQAKIESYFNENGLKANFLDGTINLLSNNLRAMVQNADRHNGTAILFECKIKDDPNYGAMAIGTKGFMIADTLKDDGTWDWKTFGTAKGFVADLITAGTLRAINLESVNGKMKIDLNKGNIEVFSDEEKKNPIFFLHDNLIALVGDLFNCRQDTGILGVSLIDGDLSIRNRSNGFELARLTASSDDTSLDMILEDGKSFIIYNNEDGLYTPIFVVNKSLARLNKQLLISDVGLINKTTKGKLGLFPEIGVYVDKTLTVSGDLTVGGNKNCVQKTKSYGDRLFYSVEDAQSFLTYTGRQECTVEKVEDRYERKIYIDEIFKECVNLKENYNIEIYKIGWGDYRIKEKTEDYFILESDKENFTFNYCIKAKRRGFEEEDMELFEDNGEVESK